jgi:hypothetical protein
MEHRVARAALAGVLSLVCASGLWGFETPDTPGPASQEAVVTLIEEADPYSGSVRVFIGIDDNVQYVEDINPFWTGETESFFVGFNADIAYTTQVAPDFLIIPSINLGYTFYFDQQDAPAPPGFYSDDARDYSLTVFQPRLEGRYLLDAAGRPGYLAAAYFFRFEDADIAAVGLDSHNLSVEGGVEAFNRTTLGATFGYGWDDYDVAFPASPGFNQRDGER